MKPSSPALFLAFLIASFAYAGDGFRVDTLVYQKGVADPIGRSTTYFTAEFICDVSGDSDPELSKALLIDRATDTATIFDHPPVGGQTVATPKKGTQVACRISYDELLRTVAAISTRIEKTPPLVQFAAAPEFAVAWSQKGNRLSMNAELMRYAAETRIAEGGDRQIAADYREFADWSARASATRRYGLPPNARIRFNEELSTKSHVPVRVEVTRKAGRGEVALYSTHEYQWQLTDADFEQLAFWRKRAAEIEKVDLVTLRHGAEIVGQNPASPQLK